MSFKKTGTLLVVTAIALLSTVAHANQTAPNNDGKGNVVYLDRHYLDCNGNGMVGFGLFRPTRTTIAYDYACANAPIAGRTLSHTLPNDDGRGDMRYLDRHSIDCGGRPILGFGLYRPNTSTIGYQYYCGANAFGSVETFETRATDDGKGNMLYLDRQRVNCRRGVLTRFQLFRPTNSTIAYEYSCGY